MIKIEQIGFLRNQLGEGPLWDDELQCFFWIDSLKGEIWRLDKEDEIIDGMLFIENGEVRHQPTKESM